MSNDDYLKKLLADQDLNQEQINSLRFQRELIESQLAVLSGSPRFYYAGSYAKKTIINTKFDLDIVILWPRSCRYTLKELYEKVGGVLQRNWRHVNSKTVAWSLPFQGGFHIDVVPGRALDSSYQYANLYNKKKDSSFQTSIKMHIDTVRKSNCRDVIRLMKLWRNKKNVPIEKSLVLELMTINACQASRGGLEEKLISALTYLERNILKAKIIDPANSNNVISDEITKSEKVQIKEAAKNALEAKYWHDVLT